MTTSRSVALSGAVKPRVHLVPPSVSSAGQEAVELAASAGLVLDGWQSLVLDDALGERADGQWSAFEVALIVSRQNGKGSVLEARELAGLFLFGEELILHSAHEFKTAQEAFRRILLLVDNTDDLRKKVARVRTSHGEEGIELRNGARLRFIARSTGSGRGFSGDCVIFDEAYALAGKQMAAILPVLSARPNPQVWYTSSAGMVDSEQLRAVRERGISGESESLAYFEYSAPADCDLDDRDAWALSNPALGIRITEEFISREREALGNPEFARERLGVWDDDLLALDPVIPLAKWNECYDAKSRIGESVAVGVDMSPDRSTVSIIAAGECGGDEVQIEVVEQSPAGNWIIDRIVDVVHKWSPVAVVIDQASPAAALVPDLEERGIVVELTTARDLANACGSFYDLATTNGLKHLGDQRLLRAVQSAAQRPLGDSWAWSRRISSSDITALVAATLAVWGFRAHTRSAEPSVYFV